MARLMAVALLWPLVLLAQTPQARPPQGQLPRFLIEIPYSMGGYSAPVSQLSPHVQAGRAKLRANDLAGALSEYSQAIADDPGDLVAYRERSGVEERQRRLDDALADLTHAVEQAPTDADNYFYRGQFEWNTLHNQAAAAADFDRAVELHNGKVQLSTIYRERAENDLDLHDSKNPHTPTPAEWQSALDDADRAVANVNAPGLPELEFRAAILADMGNFADALADFDEIISLHRPNDANGMSIRLQDRGKVRQAAGDVRGAMADFTAAIATGAQTTPAYRSRADLRRAQGDLTGAQADEAAARGEVPVASEPPPPDASPLEIGARAKLDAGDSAGTIADLSQAINASPDRAALYVERARAEKVAGRDAEALADDSRAIDLDPNNFDTRIARANLRERRNDREGAIADITVAIQAHPDDWNLVYTRGRWEAGQQKNEQAIADFDRALQLAPPNTPGALASIRQSRTSASNNLAMQQRARAQQPPDETVKFATHLGGPAFVGMPVWLYADGLTGDLTVRYPYSSYPYMIGSNIIELRRDGATVPQRPPRGGVMIGGGPMGRVTGSAAPASSPQGRLPLHVLYDLKPGHYSARWTVVGHDFSPGKAPTPHTWAESDWLEFDVTAPTAAQREQWLQSLLANAPSDKGMLVGDYLPAFLAALDDPRVQRAVMEQIYSADSLVASFAAGIRFYFPAKTQLDLTLAMLHERGPSTALGPLSPNLSEDHASEIAQAVLPYLTSSNDSQVEGTIDFLMPLRGFSWAVGDETMARVDRAVEAATPAIISRGGGAARKLSLYLSPIAGETARELLWSIVDKGSDASEQAAIAILWRRDPSDLPRIQAWLLLPSNTGPRLPSPRRGVVGDMWQYFGDAALPVLHQLLSDASDPAVKVAAAQALLLHGDAAAFQFALDAANRNDSGWGQLKFALSPWLPANATDTDRIEFLRNAIAHPPAPAPPQPTQIDPVESLVLRLRSPDASQRQAAARDIVAMPPDSKRNNLYPYLMNDIIRASQRGPDAVKLDSVSWRDGVILLGRLHLSASSAALVEYLPRDVVVSALVELGPSAVPDVSDVLQVGGPAHRAAAANVLGQIGGPDARATLESALKTESDATVLDSLRHALDHLGQKSPPLGIQ